MNRRRFLSALSTGALGAAIAPTLDLDRLLWVPGQKTYFLPTLGYLSPLSSLQAITNDALAQFTTYLHDPQRLWVDGHQLKHPYGIAWKQVMFSLEGCSEATNIRSDLIQPGMQCLASAIHTTRVTQFAELPTDTPGQNSARATDPVTGISLRGTRFYDSDHREMLVFDCRSSDYPD